MWPIMVFASARITARGDQGPYPLSANSLPCERQDLRVPKEVVGDVGAEPPAGFLDVA